MKPEQSDIERKIAEIIKALKQQSISAKIVLIGLKVLYILTVIYLIFLIILISVYA